MSLLAYQDRGSGPPVLLLHGLGGSKDLWYEVSNDLVLSGFRVITVDLRGHGASPEPSPPWTISNMAYEVVELLDHLEIDQAITVGHSMGGRVTWALALDHQTRVAGVVSIASHSESPSGSYREALERLRNETAVNGMTGFKEEFARMGEFPARLQSDQEFALRYWEVFRSQSPSGMLAAIDAILSMPSLTERLPGIAVPTLVIVGSDDREFVPFARLYGELIEDCTLVELSGGHDIVSDAPSMVSASIAQFSAIALSEGGH